MKVPTFLLAPLLAFAIGSCSSEPEESIVPGAPDDNELPGQPMDTERDRVGPWTVAEDDNRTRLDSCGLVAVADGNATGITASWSIPGNGSGDTLYRLEVAESKDFSNGYLAFANLKETSYHISQLKPATKYHLRLQAYPAPDGNASVSTETISFAPSEPEIAQVTTTRNRLISVEDIELTIEHGKFSAKWTPPANASGKLEYVVGLHSDEALKDGVDIRLLKEPMVKDWIVEPGLDYWLQVRVVPDPDSTNQSDSDSPPLVKQFHVPGNQLKTPENFKVTTANDNISLSWDPINNNSQNFEYLLMAYINEERSEPFGEYHLNVPRESISSVNQNPRYWFDLQAVPAHGNHSDLASEIVSHFLELPTTTYASPKISTVNLEAIDDPDTPGAIVKISWEGSANGDGQQKYRVEIADDEEFLTGFQDHEEDAGSVGAEIGPLDPGRTYYLRMRAVGPLDDGTRFNSEYSEIKTFVTPGAPPPVEPNE